jgi:hypothetical protein
VDVVCSVIFGAFVVLGVLAHLEQERADRADGFEEDPSVAEASMADGLVEDEPPGPAAVRDAAAGVQLGDEALTSAPSTRAAGQRHHICGTGLLPSRNARRRSWH